MSPALSLLGDRKRSLIRTMKSNIHYSNTTLSSAMSSSHSVSFTMLRGLCSEPLKWACTTCKTFHHQRVLLSLVCSTLRVKNQKHILSLAHGTMPRRRGRGLFSPGAPKMNPPGELARLHLHRTVLISTPWVPTYSWLSNPLTILQLETWCYLRKVRSQVSLTRQWALWPLLGTDSCIDLAIHQSPSECQHMARMWDEQNVESRKTSSPLSPSTKKEK